MPPKVNATSLLDTAHPRTNTRALGKQAGLAGVVAETRLTDLRAILQYIPQFREKTFVLAIDGGIVTDDNFPTLLLDVAVLWSLNIRVVLVHGGRDKFHCSAENTTFGL